MLRERLEAMTEGCVKKTDTSRAVVAVNRVASIRVPCRRCPGSCAALDVAVR